MAIILSTCRKCHSTISDSFEFMVAFIADISLFGVSAKVLYYSEYTTNE